MTKHVDHSTKNSVVGYLESGKHSYPEIAELCNCSYHVVKNISKKLGTSSSLHHTTMQLDNALSDIESGLFNQKEIAVRNGYSKGGISKIVIRYSLQHKTIGYENKWSFVESSPQLCYIIGAYITDGNISFKGTIPSALRVLIADSEFADKIESCIKLLALRTHRSIVTPYQSTIDNLTKRNGKAPIHLKDLYKVSCNSKSFCEWLHSQCHRKDAIPEFIFNAPVDHQIAFLAGAIDGDGSISQNGVMKIVGIDGWLKELPALLDTMHIRHNGYMIERILESGKEFGKIIIRRSDYCDLGGWCSIPRKQQRLDHAEEVKRTSRNQNHW